MNLNERDLVSKLAEVLEIKETLVTDTPFVILLGKMVQKYENEMRMKVRENQTMKLNDYQEITARTAPHFDDIVEEMTAWAMGIAGEAGEYCDIVKKEVWHNHPMNHEKKALELGDLMYYIARSASVLGYTLDEICTMNVMKLNKRYPNGFKSEDSINRKV